VTLLIIYLSLRIGALLIPSVVFENKVDFARLWALTRGNFGRIFVVAAAIAVPLILIYVVVAFELVRNDLRSVMSFADTSDQKAMAQQVVALQDVLVRHTPELMGLGLIMTPFAVGLCLAASASAYRTLSGSVSGTRAVTV
jgi:hypothetical protein